MKAIYQALFAARQAMGPVVKNQQNPHLRNYYADLRAVTDTIDAAIESAGLVYYQLVGRDEGGSPTLTTVLAHPESGETIETVAPIVSKDKDNPQALGGAITYMRRYSLLALFGLAPEDDDGNAASNVPAQARPAAAPARPAQTGGGRPAASGGGERKFRGSPNKPISPAQKNMIGGLLKEKMGAKNETAARNAMKALGAKPIDEMTSADASDFIEQLQGLPHEGAGDPETPGF